MSIRPMFARKITHWFARRSFQNRIFLLILFTSTIVMLAMSWYLTSITEERLHYQVGQRALIQAMQISAMPELVDAVEKHDLPRIKELIDPMRSFSDATYITVGDAKGRRLYHVNPEEIGKSMEGGDSDEALYNAKSYVSVRKGSLGSSLRGKSPIQDSTGKVIGIVSVGYTIEQLENWLSLQIGSLMIPMAIMLLLLLYCARRFSLHIKKQMLNMEPQQLSQLLIQQSVLFESVFEGLIAIDSHYRITAINQTARRLLNLSQPETILIGKSISSVISQEAFFYDAPQTNKKDEIVTFNQIKVIASRMAVTLNNEPQGWVISFRSKDDINTLSLQLSQVQQYADNLRAVQHEHRNLISTIAGLLFLKRYDNALDLIQQQSESHAARQMNVNMRAGLPGGERSPVPRHQPDGEVLAALAPEAVNDNLYYIAHDGSPLKRGKSRRSPFFSVRGDRRWSCDRRGYALRALNPAAVSPGAGSPPSGDLPQRRAG